VTITGATLEGITDRFLNEAIANPMNGVLCEKTETQRFFITSNILAVDAFKEENGRFAFCAIEVLERMKEKLADRIARLNEAVKDRSGYPYPVRFTYAVGNDHILLWFTREKKRS